MLLIAGSCRRWILFCRCFCWLGFLQLNTQLCQMLTDFQNPFTDRLSSKFSKAIIKYATSPQMRRYTTLWNVCAQTKMVMLQRWVEQTAMQNLVIQKSSWKYSSNDVSIILFTDGKIFFSGHTQKHKESPSVRNCSNQEERRRDKTLAHTISVQTVTDVISRRVTTVQVVEKRNTSLINWYLSIQYNNTIQ